MNFSSSAARPAWPFLFAGKQRFICALSGRFAAPGSFAGWYHEEKATSSVETLPYIASLVAV
jgi:hypothetical protein